MQSGEVHDEINDQGFDAGDVVDGTGLGPGFLRPTPPAATRRRLPPATDTKHKKKGDKSSSIDDPKFLEGYRTAYTTIYDRHDYASAIEQLKALDREDVADVANLIGYSYRKLGNYQLSQAYYQQALKDDPNHVRTWQYYAMWQLERGNREQAQYHLSKIEELAGTDSRNTVHFKPRWKRRPAPVSSTDSFEHDPEKWVPVFRTRSCSINRLEREDD